MSVDMDMSPQELFQKHCSGDVMSQEEQDNMFEEVREILDADIISKLKGIKL